MSNNDTQWSYTGSASSASAGTNSEQPNHEGPKHDSIAWTASEYISHEKTPTWFAALGSGATVLCALVYLLTRDFVAVGVIGVSALLLGVYAVRRPQTRSYKLDHKGLQINEDLHPFSKFKSFSIVEEGAIDSIWLKPLRRLSPVVVVYFAPEEEAAIVEVLSNYLPHEQRELDQIDRLSKHLRF